MPYYAGDYYRGDYYRGDPGLLSALGKVVGTVAGVAGKVLPGPVGAVATAVGRVLKPTNGTSVMVRPSVAPSLNIPQLPAPTSFATMGSVQVASGTPGAVPTPGLGGTVARIIPGGKTGYELPTRGYHINKYYAKYGHFPEPSHNIIVKNRHVNPLNPRAIMRATSRMAKMTHIMRRVLKGTGYVIKRTGLAHKHGRKRR